MRSWRVVIVDDEPLAVRRLERLVGEIDGAEVVAAADGAGPAREICRRHEPDVVLLDVDMPGTSGVELARELAGYSPPPRVIFTTAHEDYAVEAFDLAAMDYLVKPVRRERLARALDRLGRRPEATSLRARLGDRQKLIPIDQVRACIAEDKYTRVHHTGGEELVDDALVALEKQFPEYLLRIHRNALVSRAHIRELFRNADGHTCLRLADCGATPEVSRRNLPQVRRLLRDGLA